MVVAEYNSVMSMGISLREAGASSDVIQAIKQASNNTGVDFDYLVNQARTESSFRTDVKAKTSSATGLYQFIDQTWLGMVSKHGSKHGLGEMAAKIKQDFQGRYYVPDETAKQDILNLRKDAGISSLMAAEFASDNGNYLKAKTGKDATATDLYMAHFLGAGGASKFIKAMQETPSRPAAYLMPAAASANKNIFYNTDGSPKSLEQIYKRFEAKFGEATDIHLAENHMPHAVEKTVEKIDRTYRRDIQFERMYGDNITTYVRGMPSVKGFEGGSFFEGLYGERVSSLPQNRTTQNALFLTLTMLDLPK
jgi:hypothetical protein